jgi:hypothetical protein
MSNVINFYLFQISFGLFVKILILCFVDKPEVVVHLLSNPSINKSVDLIETSNVDLYCNASAQPAVSSYQWFLNGHLIEGKQIISFYYFVFH